MGHMGHIGEVVSSKTLSKFAYDLFDQYKPFDLYESSI
jgi:hypothetical protein